MINTPGNIQIRRLEVAVKRVGARLRVELMGEPPNQAVYLMAYFDREHPTDPNPGVISTLYDPLMRS